VIASQRELGDLRSPLRQHVHRVVLSLADYIVINSPAVAERLKRHRVVSPERIELIPNGVNLARFSPAPIRPRLLRGKVTVGTLANLRPEKGLADFMRAVRLVREQCPDARFLIWGDGPLRTDLESLVSQLGLSGAVQFRGATDEPEVALHELDIFVLPSFSEACSNALLEAMAAGLAVVTTRVGGNPALVEHETSGLLVPPGDSAALARAIIRLLENPQLAEELGASARDMVHSNFGLEQMLSRVQALYERALSKARCGPAQT